jgi:hypothetical protein
MFDGYRPSMEIVCEPGLAACSERETEILELGIPVP